MDWFDQSIKFKSNDPDAGVLEIKGFSAPNRTSKCVNACYWATDQSIKVTTIKRDSKDEKKDTPLQRFANKVTIAGLPEAYSAKSKIDRILFRIALVICFTSIIYETYTIAMQHKEKGTAFIDHEINTVPPFPEVSICYPTMVNDSLIMEMEQFLSPELKSLMKKHNLTATDLLAFVKRMWLRDLEVGDFGNTPIFVTAKKFFDELMGQANSEDFQNKTSLGYDRLVYPCSAVLSNCTFKGRSFNCCEGTEMLTTWTAICFRFFGLNERLNDTGSTSSDPFDPTKIGLTVDVSIDWTHGIYENNGGIASDGFHIFIGTLPSPYGVPTPVPSNTDALINLVQPIKVEEISRCYTPTNAPKLKYYPHYDADGLNCQFEFAEDLFMKNLGCLFPFISYFPPWNITCTFDGTVADYLWLIDGLTVAKSADTERLYNAVASYITNGRCLPLCSRWTYPILSASFSSIQYQDEGYQERLFRNKSWSRIQILMADSMSMLHEEQDISASYLAFSDIGGMMGVYAGFSIVTFVQIAAYGVCIVFWWMRKRKVSCLL